MKVSLSCSHKDDVTTAIDILTKFGDATNPDITADNSSQIVYADVLDRLVPAVKDAVNAVNAQADEHRETFTLSLPRELALA
jgi:hypothetical protein